MGEEARPKTQTTKKLMKQATTRAGDEKKVKENKERSRERKLR